MAGARVSAPRESLSAACPSLLVRKRPGVYVTGDGRFTIHGSGRTWTLDGTNDTDVQELIRRKIPCSYRSFADAQAWLYCSVYEHGETPWPTVDHHD
jgi:hypothetical protein